jgi:DNA-binding NarL/FixJ family response regulator
VKVLVAARDARVRRALSGLLALVEDRTVGAADTATLGPELAAGLAPDVVVLELDRAHEWQDLRVIEQLARRGCPVIAVCRGRRRHALVLAAGARACLDGDDAAFADRLAEAVLAVRGPPGHP